MSWSEVKHPRDPDGKFRGGGSGGRGKGHGSPIKTTRYRVTDGRGKELGKVATPEHAEKIAAHHRNNGLRGVSVTKVEEHDKPSGSELAALPDADLSALMRRARANGDHDTAKAASQAMAARRRAQARRAKAAR